MIDLSVHSEEPKFVPGFFGNKFTKLLVIMDQCWKVLIAHTETLSTNIAYRNLFYWRLLLTNYMFKFILRAKVIYIWWLHVYSTLIMKDVKENNLRSVIKTSSTLDT